MARQEAYQRLSVKPAGDPPFGYIYSPATFPLLRLIGAVPATVSGSLYLALLICGVLAQIWVVLRFLWREEPLLFLYLAPLTLFFPGLLASGVMLGGNVAYVIYGGVFLAADHGWRRNTWRWFYLVVLAASCIKIPLISLALIAPLSSRRQWVPSITTVAAGLVVFGVERLIWPAFFMHYLQAIKVQVGMSYDFGGSPAGLLSEVLMRHQLPYANAGVLLHVSYVIPCFLMMLYLSRFFLGGVISLQQWLPVLLVGVVLLNPRLQEYDLAAVTLPIAAILWQSLKLLTPRLKTRVWCGCLLVTCLNLLALQSWFLRKMSGGFLIVLCFALGCGNLWHFIHHSAAVREAQPAL